MDEPFDWDSCHPGFRVWIMENPQVFKEFERRALEMRAVRPRYGATSIVERIRWDTMIADREATFKINNNWTAGMARLAMWRNPQLQGFFAIRG